MFGSIGGPEMMLIFIVGLVVFGPRKLPEIGRSLGKMVADFRRASSDFQRTVEDEIETEKIQKSLPQASDLSLAETFARDDETAAGPIPPDAPLLRPAEGTVPAGSGPLEPAPESDPAGVAR
jgi:Tat protein translocase TatB subunit